MEPALSTGRRLAPLGWTRIPDGTPSASLLLPSVLAQILPHPPQQLEELSHLVLRQTFYTDGFNRIAEELRVPGIPSFAALLLGDLTLVTDVPEVLGITREEVDSWTPRDPARYRTGTRLRYTGPLYAQLDLPIPERVERFLDGPRPIVYVAITSTPPELVRRVVGTLRELDVRILVAATVHELGDLEDDGVMIGGILPSNRIMPRVDLGVAAGGQVACRRPSPPVSL